VFIRYFDRVDADLVWIQVRDRIVSIVPSEGAITEGQLAQVRSLVQMERPFREIELATAGGSQSRFELRLLPVALLNADRFAADHFATIATRWIWLEDGHDIEAVEARFANVEPELVAAQLTAQSNAVEAAESSDAAILAGCVRLLEHMSASNELFSYAENLSRQTSIDFESYCERTGGLNAWRVPITSDNRARRFDMLTSPVGRILRLAIEADAAAAATVDDVVEVDVEFGTYVRTLKSRWENIILSASSRISAPASEYASAATPDSDAAKGLPQDAIAFAARLDQV
jgi:hypothetical protein